MNTNRNTETDTEQTGKHHPAGGEKAVGSNRRRFLLAAASAVSTAAVAGCSGDDSSDGGDDSSSDDNGDSGDDGSAGSDGSDENTETETESCSLTGESTRFDASGTPFVFHFEYDTGYEQPEVRTQYNEIVLDLGGVGGGGGILIRQQDPGQNDMETSYETMLENDQELVTETTYDGEQVTAITMSDGSIQVRLPYPDDENGIEIVLSGGPEMTSPCTDEDVRNSAIRIVESMEPNPDNTL
jgi:hypothetical protein